MVPRSIGQGALCAARHLSVRLPAGICEPAGCPVARVLAGARARLGTAGVLSRRDRGAGEGRAVGRQDRVLLQRRGVVVAYRTLHRFRVERGGFGRTAATMRVADGEPGAQCLRPTTNCRPCLQTPVSQRFPALRQGRRPDRPGQGARRDLDARPAPAPVRARRPCCGSRSWPNRRGAKKLSDEDRRGLTTLFWSNINPYGTFRLDMNIRPDLSAVIIPGQREPSSDTVAEDVSALARPWPSNGWISRRRTTPPRRWRSPHSWPLPSPDCGNALANLQRVAATSSRQCQAFATAVKTV